MRTEYFDAMRKYRSAVLVWCIGLGLYSLIVGLLFDSIREVKGLEDLLQAYPPELMAFFGDVTQSFTPAGYLDTWFFSYIVLVLGVFAIISGAYLIAGDEEKGILDLLLAHPISRTSLFWARFLALVTALFVILLAIWLSWAIPSRFTGLNLTWLELLRPYLPLFAVLLLFGALSTLFSLLLPAARHAAITSGALLLANFMLIGLALLEPRLDMVARLTPLYYFQGGDAAFGLDWAAFLSILLTTVVLATIAWRIFLRRDIRMAGDRN